MGLCRSMKAAPLPRPGSRAAEAAPAAAAPKARAGFPWRMLVIGASLAVGVAVLVVVGTLPRLWHDKAIQSAAAAKAAAPLVVMTAAAHRSPADAQRGLPGNCLPMLETSLYARTNGYIQERLVDIGDHVRDGPADGGDLGPRRGRPTDPVQGRPPAGGGQSQPQQGQRRIRPDHPGAGPGVRPDRRPGPAARPGPGRLPDGAGQREGGRGQH